MQMTTFNYLIKTQFLGFRYSGWQKQPGQKTVEGMLLKTLKFIIPQREVKLLGAGRTDAKVSALDYCFELFLKGNAIEDVSIFLELLNKNLPPDIRIVSITPIDAHFNIIHDSTSKEYVYLFSFGAKNHPFCAPFMANFLEDLNIDLMEKAALLFEGTHDFSVYTAQLRKNSKTIRTIKSCIIKENTVLTANFFPSKSYALHIMGAGFMRYQVRMIMGALIQLGKGELLISDIQESLRKNSTTRLRYVAPGSGLILNSLQFK